MISTKELLVEVARRLFAKKGVEKTTMNDIATESGKGRRTLYTYFNNKEDIYWEIVKKELNFLYDKLAAIENEPLTPDEKLKTYVFVRLDTFKEVVVRNGSLRAAFFQNASEVEKVRRPMEVKEIRLLQKIFLDGIEQGIFQLQKPQLAAEITLNMLKGLEKPYYKERFYQQMQQYKMQFIDALFNGILVKK